MSLMAKDYYTINNIMAKIDEELFIQDIKLDQKDLDEIYNLLSHILENRK